MTLDSDIAAFLKRIASAPPLESLSLEEARAASKGLVQLQGPTEQVAQIDTFSVSTVDGAAILVRIYKPIVPLSDPAPVIVFAHGGGWFRCTLDDYDNPCRSLANATECVVASVDYRLAPEFKFPTPLEDYYAAVSWVAANAQKIGADPSRLIVAGDSAGGNLAAAAASMARDRNGPNIVHQLLFYPVTNFGFETESYEEFDTGHMLTRAAMKACWSYYLADIADGGSPYASPLRNQNLAGLPPATILTAEFDPLRDEGEQYARSLCEAGVATQLHRLSGMIHVCIHFLGMAPASRVLFDISREAIKARFGKSGAS
ncbi:alpha/beta hydrolase [Rhizobium sp. BR 314]|uniref:alpha/beta hydrolase n=1 Tax=Rhizobium sp. BR 314 TaxID=3040013 RepID=UPI0039BED3A8